MHGNGPQVGDSLARNEIAAGEIEPLPLGVLVAETAGWIGYMIQQSLQNALERAKVARDVITVICQTEVAPDDPMLRVAHQGHRARAVGRAARHPGAARRGGRAGRRGPAGGA